MTPAESYRHRLTIHRAERRWTWIARALVFAAIGCAVASFGHALMVGLGHAAGVFGR